jgi:hypothetical protein
MHDRRIKGNNPEAFAREKEKNCISTIHSGKTGRKKVCSTKRLEKQNVF